MVRGLCKVSSLLRRRRLGYVGLYLLKWVIVMHGTASRNFVKMPLQGVALLSSGHEHVIPHSGGLYSVC